MATFFPFIRNYYNDTMFNATSDTWEENDAIEFYRYAFEYQYMVSSALNLRL